MGGVIVMIKDPIHALKKEETKKEELKKELPKVEPKQEKVKTVNFSANIIVVNKEVADPPTTEEINNVIIAVLLKKELRAKEMCNCLQVQILIMELLPQQETATKSKMLLE